MPMKKEQQIS